MTLTDDVKLNSKFDGAGFEKELETLVARAVDRGCSCDNCVIERSIDEKPELCAQILEARSTTLETNMAMADYLLTCAFCGAFTEHEGHLLPRTAFGTRIRELVGTVPTCIDCNVYLFDFPDTAIRNRCDRVRSELELKNLDLLISGGSDLQSGAGRLAGASLILRDDIATLLGRLEVLRSGGFLSIPAEVQDQILWKGVGSIGGSDTRFASKIGL